ncbi:DNA-processing protein DprA [Clostridium malenominatum]|uniref:DNA-processing protein DprA n=1 Tax=Clostridium malenominatum TaxID=1539 RepID=A0ABN1IX18_9CLOT
MTIYDIWYSDVKIPNVSKLKILKKLKNAENIFNYINSKEEIFNGEVNEPKLKNKLFTYWDEEKIKNLLIYLNKNNIKIVNYHSPSYPKNLVNLQDAPCIIYYKGDISKLNNISVSIVGSRKASYYGKNATDIICRELVKKNINIISGMASGIDAFAHWSTIKNEGFTCAVLGSGIDVIYPKGNKELYYKILENGCIVSEYAPGTKPYAYNFPLRNRIISGLSKLLIVVEASEKSGSLITANYALEQGIDVVAVPGSIFSDNSKGTNKLIKDGAYPLTSMEDIFELINVKYNNFNLNGNTNLKGNNKIIYDFIDNIPIHIDDLHKITNIDIKELYEVLFELQLKNQITCLSGNYYVKIANSI